ncbi:hypothetical protein BJ170DRAFT_297333 [Xylariales sp. AK1849]|nr:hypothetical protein BJ170DRAFT_297333 [Xylariales sp. AK1849]
MKRELNSNDDYSIASEKKRSRTMTGSVHESPWHQRSLRLACPFYVLSPDRFKSVKACSGLGFLEISRLKEHLYRCHSSRRILCARCRLSFDDEKDLDAHYKQPEACDVTRETSREVLAEGIDGAATCLLRSRKRTSAHTNDQKWYEIWGILFPHRPRPESPYMKPSSPSQYFKTKDIDDISQFLAVELPMVISKTMGQDGQIPVTYLCKFLPEILHNIMRHYLQISGSGHTLVEEAQSLDQHYGRLPATPASSSSDSECALLDVTKMMAPCEDSLQSITGASFCHSPQHMCEQKMIHGGFDKYDTGVPMAQGLELPWSLPWGDKPYDLILTDDLCYELPTISSTTLSTAGPPSSHTDQYTNL